MPIIHRFIQGSGRMTGDLTYHRRAKRMPSSFPYRGRASEEKALLRLSYLEKPPIRLLERLFSLAWLAYGPSASRIWACLGWLP